MRPLFKNIIVRIMTNQAKAVLQRYEPKIVVVVGSVGKTSTKDAVFSVVSKRFHARKSEKSLNTELGLPLTVLGLPNVGTSVLGWLSNIVKGYWRSGFGKANYPEWLVLEVGAGAPGDISQFTSWIKSDIAVVTHIGTIPVHVEFFDSIEQIIEEKRSIVRSLKPTGLLLVDADDPSSLNTRERLLEGQRCLTYAIDNASDINAGEISIDYEGGRPVGTSLNIFKGDQRVRVHLSGVLGRQIAYPALVAFAIGELLGVPRNDIEAALNSYRSPLGRMRILEGRKGAVVIDDAYNASPVAVHEALDTLSSLKTPGKKIAVLGDMLELGDYSIDEHKKVGMHSAKAADTLVTVGMRSRATAEGALDAGMDESKIFQFEKASEAGDFVETFLDPGRTDAVLVKGSQAMRMERVVEGIMLHPEEKDKLLVRQDGEWLRRH